MSLSIEQLAEAFSEHRFAETYDQLADDIEWRVVGGDAVTGSDEVRRTCEESAAYLASTMTLFEEFTVFAGNDFAVVNTVATYTEAEGTVSRVASCDIYEWAEDKVRRITSYAVELP